MAVVGDSAGGTLVNGQRIAQHVLRGGDVIQVGDTHLRYQDESAAEQSTVAPLPAAGKAAQLLAAARTQVGVTLTYDPAYTALPFPGGDVPREKGVCTDVIIRAYRDALGLDLQALVNADMRAAFGAYPRTWGLAAPDRNIDHRRVPNLRVWFARQHAELPIPRDPSGWQPGDIFSSLLAKTATHIRFKTTFLFSVFGPRDCNHTQVMHAREATRMLRAAAEGRLKLSAKILAVGMAQKKFG